MKKLLYSKQLTDLPLEEASSSSFMLSKCPAKGFYSLLCTLQTGPCAREWGALETHTSDQVGGTAVYTTLCRRFRLRRVSAWPCTTSPSLHLADKPLLLSLTSPSYLPSTLPLRWHQIHSEFLPWTRTVLHHLAGFRVLPYLNLSPEFSAKMLI